MNYQNKNLIDKIQEINNKKTNIITAIKNDQNIPPQSLSENTIENQYIIFNSFLKMNSLSNKQIRDIEKQANNFYEFHFIKSNNFETQSKRVLASKEKLIALLIKLKNTLYMSTKEKLIRNENTETISKLILHLQDQEL